MKTLQFKIPPAQAKEVLEEAISLSRNVVDQLDCSVSFCRQETNKTIPEVLEMGLNGKRTHYHFIHRPKLSEIKDDYFDIGLSTMFPGGTDYFLWIELDWDTGWNLANKYKLERMA